MNKSFAAVCALLAGFAAGYLLGGRGAEAPPGSAVVLTRIDTVHVPHPEIVVVRALGERTERLPLAMAEGATDSIAPDSAAVKLPVSQVVYEGEGYRACISGYRPSLDSLTLFSRIETRFAAPPRRRPRFAVGIQAGYGLTPHGFQPFIGVGVSVNLFEF